MAFSNTVTSAGINSKGHYYEEGTWNGAGVTTGTITAGAGTNFPANTPKITKVESFDVGSDSDDTVNYAQDVGPNKLKLTFTADDTGTYRIEGPAA